MSTNDITGDAIKTRVATETYRNNHDRIFGPKCPQCGKKLGPDGHIHTCSPQIKEQTK